MASIILFTAHPLYPLHQGASLPLCSFAPLLFRGKMETGQRALDWEQS